MKQVLMHVIQNSIGIIRKQQHQLPIYQSYITTCIHHIHKLTTTKMRIRFLHRPTTSMSNYSGVSVCLVSTAAVAATVVSALNHCPVLLSFLEVSSTSCHHKKHHLVHPATVGYPSHRFSPMSTTTRYASSGESYLPPDYTIDDDNDNDDNGNDVIPTTRRSRPRISTTTPDVVRSRLSISNNNDDMDLDEVDHDDGYVATSRIVKNKKVQQKKSNKVSQPKVSKTTSSVPLTITNSAGSSEVNNKNAGASWMERNTQFMNVIGMTEKNPTKPTPINSGTVVSSTNRASVRSNDVTTTSSLSRIPINNKNNVNQNTKDVTRMKSNTDTSNDVSNRTFREDFRGTRVFVQGLPESCRWQGLKDHFRIAGNVVFASVSSAIDPNTGQPKGHGIVQFETTAEARNAIRIMRDHPLDGNTLFVREDVQDENSNRQLRYGSNDGTDNDDSDSDDDDDDESQTSDTSVSKKGPTPPTKWKCADPEMVQQQFDSITIQTIQQILKARNQARRRRNYEACDAMRDELKKQYNVHLDDRLLMWWIGAAPTNVVQQVQGIGRWADDNDKSNKQTLSQQQQQSISTTEWRQIPTTTENDACIDPDLIFGLLQQRDIARREKDFTTADALLEQARTAPSETHLTIRIHDESKTWRVWSDEIPSSRTLNHRKNQQLYNDQLSIESPPSEQCIALCLQYAPDKVDEVRSLLLKFPGREYNILKKLKQRYLNQ
jgi:RNA recognition motif-containing protein